MRQHEEEIRDRAILDAAREIMLAIRTAPKARGRDNLVIMLADGDDRKAIAAKMEELNAKAGGGRPTFVRDAQGVLAARAVLLVGVKSAAYGLDCGWCGHASCAGKAAHSAAPCVFGLIDLGIGAGVASARLADKFIDNRMMYSIGCAVVDMGWFEPEVTLALGFPLTASAKNPQYDRK